MPCSRHPAIYGIIIGTFAYNYFNYFCMTWLPAYFIENWKLTKTDMGLFTAFSFSGMAVVAILAGVVADRLIAKGWDVIKVRKGFTIAGLAVASTEVIGVMSGSRDIALAFAIISLAGLGLATANYWALTQSLMPGAAIGRITGVQNFASNMSGIAAPVVTGRLIAMTGSYEAPMQAILVILACGIAAYCLPGSPEVRAEASLPVAWISTATQFIARLTKVRTGTPDGPFARYGFAFVEPGCARDVQMHPRLAFDELLEELGCRNRAAPASADVRQIGECALQVILVIVIERHVPHALAAGFAGRDHTAEELLVVRERADVNVTQARPRSRRSAWRHPPGACTRAGSRR